MPDFTHTLRVRYAECDAQGVVFNAHYLAFVDMGITELWRAAYGSYQAMLDRGVDVVVVSASLRFFAPARFDDELRCDVAVMRLGNTSITTRHRINRRDDLLVEVEISHVTVACESYTKVPVPDWMREGLSPFRTTT